MSEDDIDKELEARGPLDLSPWQPPPAPAGLVDAAVRGARPSGGERTLIVRPPPARAAMLAAAALATSVLALAGVVYLRLQPEPEPPPPVAMVAPHATDYAPQLGALEARMHHIEDILVVPPAIPRPHDHAPPMPPALPPQPPQQQPPAQPAFAADRGRLRITCKPSAKILIDDMLLGETPWDGQVAAGKHKVTFQIDLDRYSFWVTIVAGQTVSLAKDFGP